MLSSVLIEFISISNYLVIISQMDLSWPSIFLFLSESLEYPYIDAYFYPLDQ